MSDSELRAELDYARLAVEAAASRHSVVESVMRLRALSEIADGTTTQDLLELAVTLAAEKRLKAS